MKNAKLNIWMNLIGFNRDDEDKGVKRFLEQTGFKPTAVYALLCNSDFFNQYGGMETEYTLPPDNCAYWGIPRNAERERQPWTNYDLRLLTANLHKEGVEVYASVFGVTLNNNFHKEWIYEHSEIMRHGTNGTAGAYGFFVLKRFNDGTYYEDFFIKRVCETLLGYGMDGIHVADAFCPSGGNAIDVDFSTEFFGQFIDYIKTPLPDSVMSTLGDDSPEAEKSRSEFIKMNMREEWTKFLAWRWNGFFKKLCAALHSIGKKISVLGMYCTDPFETLYCLGIDLKGIVEAGVDTISANILPTSVYIGSSDERADFFHKYMALASTTAAWLPKGHLVSMIGVQDATEEWSMLHHAPCRHERDIYTMMAYHTLDKDGVCRALDGYMICLGDGISHEDWQWEYSRLSGATDESVEEVISPAVFWSDSAHESMLNEYIKTRRWTVHKHFYELSKRGVLPAATIKADGLSHHKGAVLVPNLDMLTNDEIEAIKSYKGAVLATAGADFNEADFGIAPKLTLTDSFSSFPLKLLVINGDIDEETKAEAIKLASIDDGANNLEGDLLALEEPKYVLNETLVFAKVTDGFAQAMTLILKKLSYNGFDINMPNIVLKLKSGAYRVYLINDSDVKYHRAFVKSEKSIIDYKTATNFPILPPRWVESATKSLHHNHSATNGERFSFDIKVQPGGVTVSEFKCK